MKNALGLYIHIPFCETKCGYCDFVSYTGCENKMEAYIDGILAEAQLYEKQAIDTIFIGGGTPSHLKSGLVEKLLGALGKIFEIEENAEISIETNPNSLTKQKAMEYKWAGVNRISIGLQATQNHLLKTIGRTHTYADFLQALENVCRAGFVNINADFIYGLPNQTLDDVVKSAELMTALPIQHISAYALKIEEGVPMYGIPPVSDELDREMFYTFYNEIQKAGFGRYEISNFAKEGYACKHNLKYWQVQDYIGLGVAAHSCYKGMRYANIEDVTTYIKRMQNAEPVRAWEEPIEILLENIMLKTRLVEGIPLSDIPQNIGVKSFIKQLENNRLAKMKEGRLTLTDAGMDIQNTIAASLLIHAEK